MRDALGPGTVLGYCTNVHAGADYAQMRANLERHALAVKRVVSPHEPMGVGLWLSAKTARELLARDKVQELRDWLNENGLLAFTFNGFPHGDFHQPVVKYAVYAPTWADPARLSYTLDLANILAQLLPAGAEGSISTLPLGWPQLEPPDPLVDRVPSLPVAADRSSPDTSMSAPSRRHGTLTVPSTVRSSFHPAQTVQPLRDLAEDLRRLESETGRYIHVNLEPEPGCYLDTADDVVRFFEDHLLPGGHESILRRYLGVCHDLCHSEVMFEDQRAVLERYRRAGIKVGKVQISSAVRVSFSQLPTAKQQEAFRQLQRLPEPRYLHQTVVQSASTSTNPASLRLYDDLPQALTQAAPAGEWRVHFHVPVFLDRFELLHTTSDRIKPGLEAAIRQNQVRHFEAETYAWGVLPEELRTMDLSAGIARELKWIKSLLG